MLKKYTMLLAVLFKRSHVIKNEYPMFSTLLCSNKTAYSKRNTDATKENK